MSRDDRRDTSLFAAVSTPAAPPVPAPTPPVEATPASPPKTCLHADGPIDLRGFAEALAKVAERLDAGERRMRHALNQALEAGDVDTARNILAAWNDPMTDSERTA